MNKVRRVLPDFVQFSHAREINVFHTRNRVKFMIPLSLENEKSLYFKTATFEHGRLVVEACKRMDVELEEAKAQASVEMA